MSCNHSIIIVVPLYRDILSDNEKISINRMLTIFSNRQICVVCPQSLEDFANSVFEPHTNFYIKYFEESYFKSTIAYNRLLMNIEFYKSFINFEYILICQLDVYVIKDEIDYWVSKKYDNIGAPIFEGYSKPSLIYKRGNNGGFCMRNTASCINVLQKIKFRYSRIRYYWHMESIWYWKLFRVIRDGIIYNYKIKFLRPIINEDMFWSVIIPQKYSWFNVCDPEESKKFAFDANPRYLLELCNNTYPMAIHAWWRYDKKMVDQIAKNFETNE